MGATVGTALEPSGAFHRSPSAADPEPDDEDSRDQFGILIHRPDRPRKRKATQSGAAGDGSSTYDAAAWPSLPSFTALHLSSTYLAPGPIVWFGCCCFRPVSLSALVLYLLYLFNFFQAV